MNSKLHIFILCFFFITYISHSQQTGEVFYLYPTPGELIEIIDEGNLSFDKNVLNPVENIDKYIDTKSRNLNLGIYLADMAYSAFFSKRTKVLDYLDVISKLSNYLLISSDVKENMMQDFTSNIDNFDSIYHFTNVYYYDIMQELEYNSSENIMNLIISGAYIECIYIAVNLAKEYTENSSLIQKVAEQKFAFINLVKSSELRKNDRNVASTLGYLEEIQSVYSNVKMIEGTKREMIRTEDGKIRFTGGPKLKIEEEQFYQLKKTITRIRTEIINYN